MDNKSKQSDDHFIRHIRRPAIAQKLLVASILLAANASHSLLAAETNAWDCQQNDDGTWVCKDSQAPVITALPAVPTPVEVSSKVEEATPVKVLPPLEITDDVDIKPIDTAGAYLHCNAPANSTVQKVGTQGKTRVQADSATLDISKRTVVFSGDARLRQDDKAIDADTISYNDLSNDATASGNVVIETTGVVVSGETGNWNTKKQEGHIEQAAYQLQNSRVRGSAARANLNNNETTDYKDISYTTCVPGNADWQLTAKELEIDHAEGVGVAKNAKLEFFDVPIAYVPQMSFPIDKRRKSGLLIPTIAHTTNTGLDISVPYYLNLAPNYDATITPRLMSSRGLLLGGEFRYLTDNHKGVLTGEILPDDTEYKDGDVRGALSLRHNSRLAQRVYAGVNAQYASDAEYLEDLGDSLAVSSTRYLSRNAFLAYHGDFWDLTGEVQYYQTLDKAIPASLRPYSQLPKVSFNWQQDDIVAGLAVDVRSEFVSFDRDEGVTGQRFDFYPAVSYPMRNSWGYIEPRIAGRYTTYKLDDQVAGLSDNPDRTTGSVSLDSGLYFDRETSWFNTKLTQTLEPRLFYLYTPEEDQSELPLFDTTERDFNFDNLFRYNRFNGVDRMGDANQLTAAISSRMLHGATGEELMRLSLGQIFYFDDREVTLSESASEVVKKDNSSEYVAELRARLADKWNMRLGAQVDPHEGSGEITQGLAQLTYNDNNERVFNISYRLRDASTVPTGRIEQTDIAMIWPMTDNLSLIGRWNYSLENSQTLEALGGFEYGRNCCWKLRSVVRQYLDDDTDDQNLSVLLQLQLMGLGSLGNDISNLLENSVYGYIND